MSSNPTSRFLLLNYMKFDPQLDQIVAGHVRQARPTDARFPRRVYKHQTGDRLLELIELPELAGLGDILLDPAWRALEAAVRPCLVADYRRQVHELSGVVRGASADAPR